jgi:hypothetical protein
LVEHEHKVWGTIDVPEGVERLSFTAVSRAYARKPDDALEAPDSIQRFLKTNGRIFSLAVDAISDPLRYAPGSQTAIVHVTGRSFPDETEMQADVEGLEASRRTLSQQRQAEARIEFTADRMKTTHQLQLATVEEAQQ